ncbi:MAG: hypothetical protein EBR82_78275 [Caulobacteraceae bacterium]|nr:hypothetical protein [Caulobacteraceae bacterium]
MSHDYTVSNIALDAISHESLTTGSGGSSMRMSQPPVDTDVIRWKRLGLGGHTATPRGTARRICDEVILQHAENGNAVCFALLVSKTRAAKVFDVRAACMKRIREELGWSYPRIGRLFGNRDHTSVMNAINPKTQTRKLLARVSKEQAHAAPEVLDQQNEGATA